MKELAGPSTQPRGRGRGTLRWCERHYRFASRWRVQTEGDCVEWQPTAMNSSSWPLGVALDARAASRMLAQEAASSLRTEEEAATPKRSHQTWGCCLPTGAGNRTPGGLWVMDGRFGQSTMEHELLSDAQGIPPSVVLKPCVLAHAMKNPLYINCGDRTDTYIHTRALRESL